MTFAKLVVAWLYKIFYHACCYYALSVCTLPSMFESLLPHIRNGHWLFFNTHVCLSKKSNFHFFPFKCIRSKFDIDVKGDGNPDDYYILYERS